MNPGLEQCSQLCMAIALCPLDRLFGHMGTRSEQRFNSRSVTIVSCYVNDRGPVFVFRVDVCFVLEQHLHKFKFPTEYRVVQWSVALVITYLD